MLLCVVACYLLNFVCIKATDQPESRLVQIDSGPVRGYKDPNEDIFVFYGIPYAKAPSGNDRFKAPIPAPVWDEPLEAVNQEIVCPQINIFGLIPKTKIIQEDCLVANVYVPNIEKTKLPVVVYIHGGAFIMGYGDLITPKKIVSNKEVIAITFNYRLGAHGFLCLGTKNVPGNAGLKDQVALLRWVKRNVASFGGNANDITLAGYSAGSVSVELLMLSKASKNLFHKVIPESGANISPFSVQIDPIKNAKEYGKLLNFQSDDIQELEDFFKSATYDHLQSANVMFRTDFIFLMSPCVERDVGEEIILDDSPFNILRSGNFDKLPMLYGFSNMEGLLRVPIFEQWKNEMNTNFSDFIPADLEFKNYEKKFLVVDKIKKFYFKNLPIDENNILSYVNYMSDIFFTCPTLRAVNLQLNAGHSNIYLYEYSFVEDTTPLVPYTKVKGAGHTFQTIAVLDGIEFTVTDESGASNDLREMKDLMRELWTNFAKNGRPEAYGVPNWPAVGADWTPYMELKKNPELKNLLLKERCSFWEEIYEKHYKNPIPPYEFSPLLHTEF